VRTRELCEGAGIGLRRQCRDCRDSGWHGGGGRRNSWSAFLCRGGLEFFKETTNMTIARCMANMLALMISLVTVAPSAQGQQ
jgi:hypothetical protein